MTTKRKKLTPEEQQALLDTPNINEEFTKATGLTLPLQIEFKNNNPIIPKVVTELAETQKHLPPAQRKTFGYKFIDWEDFDARYNGIAWNIEKRWPSYKQSDTKMSRFIQQHGWKRLLVMINSYEPNRSVAAAKEDRDIEAEECLTKGFNEVSSTKGGSAENTRKRTEAQRKGRNLLYNDENIDEVLGGHCSHTGAFLAKVGPKACPFNDRTRYTSGMGYNSVYNRILTSGPFKNPKEGVTQKEAQSRVIKLMAKKQYDEVIEWAKEVRAKPTTSIKGVEKNIALLRELDFGSLENLYSYLTDLGYDIFGGEEALNVRGTDSSEQPTVESDKEEQTKPSIWDNLLKYFIRLEATI